MAVPVSRTERARAITRTADLFPSSSVRTHGAAGGARVGNERDLKTRALDIDEPADLKVLRNRRRQSNTVDAYEMR
jgi:hypothetical protein